VEPHGISQSSFLPDFLLLDAFPKAAPPELFEVAAAMAFS